MIKELLKEVRFGNLYERNEILRIVKPRYIGVYEDNDSQCSELFFVYADEVISLPAYNYISDEDDNIIDYELYIPEIEGCEVRVFSTITEAKYFAQYGREIFEDATHKIFIVDKSDYDPDLSRNGGKYMYSDDYYYIPNLNGWIRKKWNSSEFSHCPVCGYPKDWGKVCCSEYKIFSTLEVIKKIVKALEEGLEVIVREEEE